MSSQLHLSKYFQSPAAEAEEKEELLFREQCAALIAALPLANYGARLYRGFWFSENLLPDLMSAERRFKASATDVFLVTHPKSGTTWLKALAFSVLNRRRFSFDRHPLLTVHPHDCVPFLGSLFSRHQAPDLDRVPSSPRLFGTHAPYSLLPESVRDRDGGCRIVYLSRDPKDAVVSMWHFARAADPPLDLPVGALVDLYCRGTISHGPAWAHVAEYRKESEAAPHRVMMLEYEALAEEPEESVRRLAGFLGRPFSAEEEAAGVVERIVKLCSIEFLRGLDVNKHGTRGEEAGVALSNSSFFRKGKVGDWKEHLTADMAEKLDKAAMQ